MSTEVKLVEGMRVEVETLHGGTFIGMVTALCRRESVPESDEPGWAEITAESADVQRYLDDKPYNLGRVHWNTAVRILEPKP